MSRMNNRPTGAILLKKSNSLAAGCWSDNGIHLWKSPAALKSSERQGASGRCSSHGKTTTNFLPSVKEGASIFGTAVDDTVNLGCDGFDSVQQLCDFFCTDAAKVI